MIKLNAGNLWDNEYLDTVIDWNKEFEDVKVMSLFGSIARLTPAARAVDRLPFRDWTFIDNYVDKAQSNRIAIRYTLNQSCIGPIQDFMQNWESKLKYDILELHNVGIHEWIVTSPLLVELLRGAFPNDFIEVSTIAEVATPDQARRWLGLGVDGVNISTNINRDFAAINEMAEMGITVSILANEACLFNCPWRRECYNLSSHNSLRSEELFSFYPFSRCNNVRMANPVEWIKSRLVLPQWTSRYQQLTGVEWFKVAYRTHPKEVALPILRAYMEQEFSGNLLALWPTVAPLGGTEEPIKSTYISCKRLDELHFFEQIVTANIDCTKEVCGVTCRFCEDMYNKVK